MSQIQSWDPILRRAGISHETERELSCRAARNGTTFHTELLADGSIDHRRYFRAIAERLGLPFCDKLDSSRLVLRNKDLLAALAAPHGPRIVHYAAPGARMQVLVSPARFDISEMAAYLRRYPELAARMMVVEPSVLRRALLERARPLLTARARRELVTRHPSYSAAYVANGRQGFILGLGLAGFALFCAFRPAAAILTIHWLSIFFFLSCIGLRLFAALRRPQPESTPPAPADWRHLPTYSILVALYREKEVAAQLVAALSRLNWPASKLDIKLICEEDDAETRDAFRRIALPPQFELLTVPASAPRTKPKALTYGLPTASGDFVVVYDAEDIPHPDQLLEAWLAFRRGGRKLACVQAPLEIVNGSANMLTRMFAFEYAALFRGLLPALAAWQSYLPLGGTSNHFRVDILRATGGWDPYNVTEDADLALRLCRHGYRIGTITLPTCEDAPDQLKPWFNQRSRWFKGWMRTLMVHWRNPGLLSRQLDPAALAAAHVMLLGICISSLAYLFLPAFLVVMFFKLFAGGLSLGGKILLVFDAVCVALAWLAFVLLGWRASRQGFWYALRWLPVYWMLLSFAAWHAFYKVIVDPYHWAKTPHRLSVLNVKEEKDG